MPKISSKQIKQFIALKQKKIREKEQLFVAEGEKIVPELLTSKLEIIAIVAVKEWLNANYKRIPNSIEVLESGNDELMRISSMKTPNKVLAIARIPETDLNTTELNSKLSLVLDTIQDPGNLGTIIRIADWFGIEYIVCSEDSADLYNPKVIQATMGAFLRVKVIYRNLAAFLSEIKKTNLLTVYGTFLEGNNIYSATLSATGIIVMGNESKGISTEIQSYIDKKITIPSFSSASNKTESLNVSMATAIVCSEFRRKNL